LHIVKSTALHSDVHCESKKKQSTIISSITSPTCPAQTQLQRHATALCWQLCNECQ